MEQSKRNKVRTVIADLLLIVLLFTSGSLAVLFYNEKLNLEEQVEKRDKLIRDKQVLDSILTTQQKRNERIVEKYISDCGILINGKEVSTDELLNYLRGQTSEIAKLQNRIYNLEDSLQNIISSLSFERSNRTQLEERFRTSLDSLSIYKAFYRLAKSNFNTDFTVNGDKVKITIPDDSSDMYKKIYELIKRDYGISYDIKKDGEYLVYTKNFSKADSALMIFEYYKDKLSKDSLDNIWYIEMPKRSKKKKK